MKIVINHLTRMQPGFICVAGVDRMSRESVRPVRQGGVIKQPRSELVSEGGVFDIGQVVELVDPVQAGREPHVEDTTYSRAVGHGKMDGDRFWKLMRSVSVGSIREVFGKVHETPLAAAFLDPTGRSTSLRVLKREGRNFGVEPGGASVSLGP